MRLRNVKGSRERIAASPFTYNEDEESNLYNNKGKWSEIFENDKPIFIEIGMGKGQFITELAKRNPDNNYIGIEKFSSVLIRAIEKREQGEKEGISLPNLRFIRMDAENLENVFAPEEIAGIYLNFSDPWPKDRHAKRRLTSKQFLERYLKVMKKDARIQFKTDNQDLFNFSLESLKENEWNVSEVTFDLHHSDYLEGNIMTEYESRFVAEGKPICRLVASK
ncbi:MAG: tRNA (guanosine(46)-N7)-methyltransferase TrmB [Lachnospiraceae bacterium]|nr:tRNA (guanosine(46)-N7)-methyltransferase TrmB [Lachnospiraceae bacterium]